MNIKAEVVTTDVLVIGGGFAGCFAAIRAREMGAEVLLVEQQKSGFSGMSSVGTHMHRVVLPDDDLEAAMKDTVLGCEYMVDQEYAEGALAETWDRLQEMLRYGAGFRLDDSGKIRWYFRDTQYPDFKQRCLLWEPMGTYHHILKIKTAAVQRGARVLDRVAVTDLLTSDGRVVGAVGFSTREGTSYVFQAKSVVLTAGAFEGGGGSRYASLTGDGIAMGLRAGAELRGMEFGRVETFALPPAGGGPTWVREFVNPPDKSAPIREVTIKNAEGEEFLERYELTRRLDGRKYDGPPWRVQLQAWLKECREGRGPCYADYRSPGKADRLRVLLGSYFNRNLEQIKLSGNAFDKIVGELGFGAGSSQNGGIRIRPNGESSIPGLYAGGTVSDMCCAQHYSIPANLMGTHITGRRAGESAAQFALSQSQPVTNEEHLVSLQENIYTPLDIQHGIRTDELRQRIRKAWLNIDLREEKRLKSAVVDFQNLSNEANYLKAEDYHDLVECHKLKNYVLCSEATARAALARRETRLEHIREDYPLTDNKEWLKWVVLRLEEDKLRTFLEDIPISRWKYRPEPTAVDRLEPNSAVSSQS